MQDGHNAFQVVLNFLLLQTYHQFTLEASNFTSHYVYLSARVSIDKPTVVGYAKSIDAHYLQGALDTLTKGGIAYFPWFRILNNDNKRVFSFKEIDLQSQDQ